MKYYKISIISKSDILEDVCIALETKGIFEYSIEGEVVRNDVIKAKEIVRWDYISDNEDEIDNIISIYYNEDEREEAVSLKEDLLKQIEGITVNFEEVRDEEWKDKWKESYKTQRISREFVVKPSWEDVDINEFNPTSKLIEIDPGMAFGTGAHETTSMCVELLEKYRCKGKRILDVGTGTGILAIAASLLEASKVMAIDIDEDAVKIAKENIKTNNVENLVEVVAGDLTKGITFEADIVVANLISSLIITLSDSIKLCMKEKACFIVSGILIEQKEKTILDLKQRGFEVDHILEKNEWCAISFVMNR